MPLMLLLTGLAGLAGCATEPAEAPAEVLPLPPTPPPRPHALRPVQRQQAGPNGEAPAAAEEAPAVVAAAAAAAPVWRVARDGIVGCADRATLAVLDQAAEGAPRLIAEARTNGGCRTTFRVNEWVMEGSDGELVRLRLTNGPALTLWFRRGEVVAP
jgi:hypothetical protein